MLRVVFQLTNAAVNLPDAPASREVIIGVAVICEELRVSLEVIKTLQPPDLSPRPVVDMGLAVTSPAGIVANKTWKY